MPDALWIFGYGSLIWRPGFAFAERQPGRVDGFARRFWQGSTDHRGVPGAPGRVVTLVPDATQHCWGAVFRVESEGREALLTDLDHRERGGFARTQLSVRLADGSVPAITWVADERNPNYLGPAPLEVVAEQVRRARGPSGDNLEYVVELARALRQLGAEDAHVLALEQLLRPGPDPAHPRG